MAEFKSNLHKMAMTTKTDFWNDSCCIEELGYAVDHGAVGATANPVIAGQVIKENMAYYEPIMKELIAENPNDTEDEITWKVISRMTAEASKILMPVYEKTNGEKGYISVQVSPKFYNSSENIIAQAVEFNQLAKNIMVKMPVTDEGLKAIEECTYLGIAVNATVSFTLSQGLAVAEAIEKGLKRREEQGLSTAHLYPVCTIMVGRLDDYLKSTADKRDIIVDPLALELAGVAVFKKAYKIYKEKGYKTKLLAAAYRNHYHWSEFVGGDVALTIPPKWIKRFNKSDVEVIPRMESAVDEKLIIQLKTYFPEFAQAYEADGLKREEFTAYGATKVTLMQFLKGYDDTIKIIRDIMMNS